MCVCVAVSCLVGEVDNVDVDVYLAVGEVVRVVVRVLLLVVVTDVAQV